MVERTPIFSALPVFRPIFSLSPAVEGRWNTCQRKASSRGMYFLVWHLIFKG
ncbi:Hypothetical predicted protein, partial [Pelobates cultripes]